MLANRRIIALDYVFDTAQAGRFAMPMLVITKEKWRDYVKARGAGQVDGIAEVTVGYSTRSYMHHTMPRLDHPLMYSKNSLIPLQKGRNGHKNRSQVAKLPVPLPSSTQGGEKRGVTNMAFPLATKLTAATAVDMDIFSWIGMQQNGNFMESTADIGRGRAALLVGTPMHVIAAYFANDPEAVLNCIVANTQEGVTSFREWQYPASRNNSNVIRDGDTLQLMFRVNSTGLSAQRRKSLELTTPKEWAAHIGKIGTGILDRRNIPPRKEIILRTCITEIMFAQPPSASRQVSTGVGNTLGLEHVYSLAIKSCNMIINDRGLTAKPFPETYRMPQSALFEETGAGFKLVSRVNMPHLPIPVQSDEDFDQATSDILAEASSSNHADIHKFDMAEKLIRRGYHGSLEDAWKKAQLSVQRSNLAWEVDEHHSTHLRSLKVSRKRRRET